ncbi:urease accessory protein UreE, partial [Yersinia pestis]
TDTHVHVASPLDEPHGSGLHIHGIHSHEEGHSHGDHDHDHSHSHGDHDHDHKH